MSVSNIFNKAFAALALMASATAFADADYGFYDGCRFDYFDKQGTRILSSYINSPSNQLLYVGSDNQVNIGADQSFFKMSPVPYGTENYDFKVETQIEDIDPEMRVEVGGFEIIDSELEQEAPRRAEGNLGDNGSNTFNFKCGTTFKFYIDVPAGKLPALEITGQYTEASSQVLTAIYTYPTLSSMGAVNWLDSNNRYLAAKAIEDPCAPYLKDESVPDRYWITFTMENEPVTIKAYSVNRNDKEWLELAVNNLYDELYEMYNSQQYLGETLFTTWIGDALSQDVMNSFIAKNGASGWHRFLTLDFDSNNYVLGVYQFKYAMLLVERSNFLLDVIEKYPIDDIQAMEIARASCLALRSHAYLRLLQTFGHRYEDSNEMQALCLPLITSFPTTEEMTMVANRWVSPAKLASMKEVYDRTMTDLNTALNLFEKNHYEKSKLCRADANMVHGTMARLALLAHDWQTAADHAAEVIKNVAPVMSNEEFQSGFYAPTSSWVWGAGRPYHFASWQQFWACNGAYSDLSALGTSRINLELYQSLDDKDIRKKQFFTYENFPDLATKARWFNNQVIDSNTIAWKSSWSKMICEVIDAVTPDGLKPAGGETYYGNGSYPYYIGFQMKFYAHDGYPDFTDSYEECDKIPFMRGEEMLLTLAEANWELGKYADATNYLNQLNFTRIGVDYVAPSNPQELLEEIRKTRRIELWGEGFGFFDFKRWYLPNVRKAWVANGVAEGNGNLPEHLALNTEVTACNKWRLPIPNLTSYYTGIDYDALKYDIEYDYSLPNTGSESMPRMATQMPEKFGNNRPLPLWAAPSTQPITLPVNTLRSLSMSPSIIAE